MNTENEGLFRKTSLERVSSPEKLNEYIKIANPMLTAILITVFAILTAAAVWLFTSNIPKYTDISGIATISAEDTQQAEITKVYSYINLSLANKLSVGMEVNVSPEYAPREEYGYIKGSIINIGQDVVTNAYLYEKFENPILLEPVLPKNGNFIEVEILLNDWTNERSKDIKLINGTICDISVTTSNRKAYEVIS